MSHTDNQTTSLSLLARWMIEFNHKCMKLNEFNRKCMKLIEFNHKVFKDA